MSGPNPYAPPQAAVKDLPAGAGSAIKAVTLGLVADIGGTLAGTVVFMLIYGIVLGVSGASAEELAAASDFTATDSWQFYAGTLLGLGFSVLGGYVCARIARRSEMKLGAVLALLSAAIGVLLAADQYQLGTLLSVTLASIGAVMVGARLGQAKNRGNK
jgi:hypothetical protein